MVSCPGGDGVSAESLSEVCHGEVPGVPTPPITEVESASSIPTELGAYGSGGSCITEVAVLQR
jgi:hypothetical protein